MKRIVLVSLMILGAALMASGCSDDDPVTPDPEPQPLPVATTPDSLMSLYRTVWEDMDTELLDALLGENFRMVLSEWDGTIGSPPPDYMTPVETILAVENMAGGGDVTNWRGNPTPGVTQITVEEWTPQTDWSYSPNGQGASSTWYLGLTVDRGPGDLPINVAGDYEVIVELSGGKDQPEEWTLFSLDFRGRTTPEEVSLMAAHLDYLTNEPPTADFEFTEHADVPWPRYVFDANTSSDPEDELQGLAFQWQFGEGAHWTGWGGPISGYTFETEGPHQVTLEVRDRWWATAQSTQLVSPARTWLPFPDSPEQLMANFQSANEWMDFEEYRRLLHPDFQMILQQETIEEFPDVGTTMDLNEDLRAHQRMFSGDHVVDPVTGALVPGMESIEFRVFSPLDTWEMAPPNDPIPNALAARYSVDFMFNRGQQFSTLKAEGIVRFYVTSRDSLHEGSMKQYYQMVGQLDLTGGFKGVESANYGSIKAIYR